MTADFRLGASARVLRLGGIIAYPTEAVWGLGCDPRNEDALESLLRLKGRDPDKGLILVGATTAQFAPLIEALSDRQRDRLRQTWPGPFTWLVPHRGLVHPLVHGRFDTVALRVSDHPVIIALCSAFGGPVVSTSANPQGRRPALSARQVRHYFGGGVDYVLPGDLGRRARPTEICHIVTGGIVRPA